MHHMRFWISQKKIYNLSYIFISHHNISWDIILWKIPELLLILFIELKSRKAQAPTFKKDSPGLNSPTLSFSLLFISHSFPGVLRPEPYFNITMLLYHRKTVVSQRGSKFSITGNHSPLSKWSTMRSMQVPSKGFQGVSWHSKNKIWGQILHKQLNL